MAGPCANQARTLPERLAAPRWPLEKTAGGGRSTPPLFFSVLLPPVHDDLVRRRPVWLALSDLFLDTDVSLFRQGNARLLAACPYSLEELDAILTGEVYLACSLSLRGIAGEWAGFDSDWLEGRIRLGGAPPRLGWRRWPRYLLLGWEWPVRLPAEWADWRAEVARLRERPERSTASTP